MSSSGYLVLPSQDLSKEELWTETWKRIDRFLPDLRSDLALEEPTREGPSVQETQDVKHDDADISEGGVGHKSFEKEEVEVAPLEDEKTEIVKEEEVKASKY